MAAGTITLATGLAAGGSAYQYEAGKKQERAQRRAEKRQAESNRINKARSDVERALSRRRAVGQARQAQALNMASGLAAGIGQQSSALQGVNSAVGSNLTRSVSQANRAATTGQQTFDLANASALDINKANRSAARMNMYSSWANRASSFLAGNAFALGTNPSTTTPTTS